MGSEANNVLAILEKYGQHVKELKFCGRYPANKSSITTPSTPGWEVGYWRKQMLPESTRSLLKLDGPLNEKLIVLDTITIGFDSDPPSMLLFQYLHGYLNDGGLRHHSQNILLLNDLMAKTWTLLSENPKIRHLKLQELPPTFIEAWTFPSVTAWFRQLESLEVSLWGRSLGMTHCTGYPRYFKFCFGLEELFRHLEAVKTLKFKSGREGMLGLVDDGNDHIRLPFRPNHLPNLRRLELVNCFVCPELSHFLEAHARSLDTLVLRDCCAKAGFEFGWSNFLESISSTNSILSDLQILSELALMTSYEFHFTRNVRDLPKVERELMGVRESLRNQKIPRRLFEYALICEAAHKPLLDPEVTLSMYHDGSDQRAYDELINIVKLNALNKRTRKPEAWGL